LVTAELQQELFKTNAAARAFAQENFNARQGEYAAK
jgi:hypothetical protein